MRIAVGTPLGNRAKFAPMMARPPLPTSLPAIAERLRKLQTASGLSQSEFARLVGIGKTSWNHYVNGERRISINQAIKICETINGITTDYIFRGIGPDPKIFIDLMRGSLPPSRGN